MKNRKEIVYLLCHNCISLFILVFIYSCAIQERPGGGPKDNESPKIVNEIPPNYSSNFKDEKIILKFDEFISLKNISSEMIISPPLNNAPKINLKKKEIIITFEKSSLKDSTTYCINFGNSIVDITEGNITEEFRYVLSTGTEIDTTIIKGKVLTYPESNTSSNIKIFLYHENCDSCFFGEKPLYYTRTNTNGEFVLNNIKSSKYRLFALEDLNNNFYYDVGEKIGFVSTIIDLKNDTNLNTIIIFNEKQKNSVRDFKISSNKRISIKFNSTPDINKIIASKEIYKFKSYFDSGLDSLFIWYNLKNDENSFNFVFQYDTNSFDTLQFIDNIPNIPPPLKVINYKIDILNNSLVIKFSNPIESLIKEKVKLFSDTKEAEIKIRTDSIICNQIIVENDFEKNFIEKISFADSIVKDIFGNTNDSFTIYLNSLNKVKTGVFILEYDHSNSTEKVIVELLNSKNDVLCRSIVNYTKTIKYNYLQPGKYQIRFILDKNKNNIWDTGMLDGFKYPETIIYFPKEIIIRANWEIVEKFLLNPE